MYEYIELLVVSWLFLTAHEHIVSYTFFSIYMLLIQFYTLYDDQIDLHKIMRCMPLMIPQHMWVLQP